VPVHTDTYPPRATGPAGIGAHCPTTGNSEVVGVDSTVVVVEVGVVSVCVVVVVLVGAVPDTVVTVVGMVPPDEHPVAATMTAATATAAIHFKITAPRMLDQATPPSQDVSKSGHTTETLGRWTARRADRASGQSPG